MKKIIVVSYQTKWNASFIKLQKRLQKTLLKHVINIHHVGSTAVKGLAAKPIIDIDIEIDSMQNFTFIKHSLRKIGYHHVGDQGISGREVFKIRKFSCLPHHHLYVCARGTSELLRHLGFRDYLRGHPEVAEAYANIKRKAAQKYPYEMKSYLEAKGKFIQEIYSELNLR